MKQSLFHYISPLLLPILPSESGTTQFALHVRNMLEDVAPQLRDESLTCSLEHVEAGQLLHSEQVEITVRDGVSEPLIIDRQFSGSSLGYLQVSLVSEQPVFRKLLTEHAYSLVVRPDGSTFVLNASFKFSVPIIIGQMHSVGRFCLVHPAHYVNQADRIGNSTLIINPFDGPLLVRMSIPQGKELRKRINPHHAVMIPLEELIDDDRLTCVLYSGNNRYPAWDVRHTLGDYSRINRIDHLEYFRSDPTIRHQPLAAALRSRIKRRMTTLALRG